MRALDCVHDAHDDKHLVAEDDEGLVAQVMQHRDEYHPELTDDDVQQVVAQRAYDE